MEIRWKKYALVSLIPAFPLFGLLLSGAPAFSFLPALSPSASSLLRYTTGLPVSGGSVEPSRGRGAFPFSWPDVQRRAAAWKWTRLESPRWRLLMTEHAAVRSDDLKPETEYAALCLEEALGILSKILPAKTDDLRFSLRLFRNREEFETYARVAGASTARSFYHPGTYEAVVYRNANEPLLHLAESIFHETAHLYLHRVFDQTEPLWFSEGVAEHLRGFLHGEPPLQASRINPDSRDVLRASRTSGHPIPLDELEELSRDRFYRPDHPEAYAQSELLLWILTERCKLSLPVLLSSLQEDSSLQGIGSLEEMERLMREEIESWK